MTLNFLFSFVPAELHPALGLAAAAGTAGMKAFFSRYLNQFAWCLAWLEHNHWGGRDSSFRALFRRCFPKPGTLPVKAK